MKLRRCALVTATMAVLLAMGVAPTNAAAVDDPSGLSRVAVTNLTIEQGKYSSFTIAVPQGRYVDAAGVTRTSAAALQWTCIGRSNNPHFSSGSGGVIAKAG